MTPIRPGFDSVRIFDTVAGVVNTRAVNTRAVDARAAISQKVVTRAAVSYHIINIQCIFICIY